jgi:four helix bundle protein
MIDLMYHFIILIKEMEKSQSFEDLIVWQKAHSFVLAIYRMTTIFPNSEIYNLTSQFRRAGVSIPANIAEGYKRLGRADKARFYNIAQGSLEECRYYLRLSKDLNYLSDNDYQENKLLLEEVSRLLNSYAAKVSGN